MGRPCCIDGHPYCGGPPFHADAEEIAYDAYADAFAAGQRAAYLAEWERCDFALWAEVLFGVHPDDAGDTEFAEYLAEEWARLRLLAREGA